MQKEVIYIEPEDDITDIITKIEGAKEKIVALVPPKKASVFRSVVNIKLIAKSATSSGRTVVIVTTDPSIIKIAGLVHMLVTHDLESAPFYPEAEDFDETGENTTLTEGVNNERTESASSAETDASDRDDDDSEGDTDEEDEEIDDEDDPEDEEEEEDSDDDDDENAENDKKSSKKSKKSKSGAKKGLFKNAKAPFLVWINRHQPLFYFLCILIIALVALGVWAFVIAPAATITVGIRTESGNFSENVAFTETAGRDSVEDGVFSLTEYPIRDTLEQEFTATGSKNVGDKATGTVVAVATFWPSNTTAEGGNIAINAGSQFTINGLTFVSDSDGSISWDGDEENCENLASVDGSKLITFRNYGCVVSVRINVTAAEPGASYNIPARTNTGDWSTTANVNVYSDYAMSGGTDKTVTIVSQSDVDSAIAQIQDANEDEYKTKLLATIGDSILAIDSSFALTTSTATATPAVGEEVEDGVTPKVSVEITGTMFGIDKTKVEEYIEENAKIRDTYRIYTLNEPFIENFMNSDSGYIGKLKASYTSGPDITDNDILEVVAGKGFGTAQHDLSEISGIGTVTIDGSYPWVTSFPSDTNKITVIIEDGEQ